VLYLPSSRLLATRQLEVSPHTYLLQPLNIFLALPGYRFRLVVPGGPLMAEDDAYRQTAGELPTGRQCRDRLTINMLPDELLLAVFDFYMCGAHDKRAWMALVHVCRRWRPIVFASPHRLDLRLVCTDRTPVREMLHIWPALPITVRISSYKEISDDVVAALEHIDRVREIYVEGLYGDGFEKLATVPGMQDPFPALTHLHLDAYGEAPIVPDSFLGSAPLLRSLYLKNFEYPALPKLLLSATGLVNLCLFDRGYITPQMMVNCLASLTRLEKLEIGFRSHWHDYRDRRRRPSRHPPPPTRRTDLRPLPVLATLAFKGEIGFFDRLFTHIDAPRIEDIDIRFNRPPFFDFSRIFLFTDLKETFEALDQAHMVVTKDRFVNVTLSSRRGTTGGKVLRLLFKGWEVLGWIQDRGCRSLPANSERMDVCNVHAMDRVENEEWLELFHYFAAVGNLYLSEALAMCVAPALQELVGNGVTTQVLPALENLFIEKYQPSGPINEAIGGFVTARELSGHPVTVQSWAEEPEIRTVQSWTEEIRDTELEEARGSNSFGSRVWGVLFSCAIPLIFLDREPHQ